VQRFAQSSLFKRTVLEHIAADLLTMHFKPQDASSHGGKGTLCTLLSSLRHTGALPASLSSLSSVLLTCLPLLSRHTPATFSKLPICATCSF
jgi:hypothetical protein